MGIKDFFQKPAFLYFLQIAGIIISLGAGATAILVLIFAPISLNPLTIVSSVYLCLLAAIAIVAEFKIMFILRWFFFLVPYIGLGFYYVFFGLFTMFRQVWWSYLVGAVVIAFGVLDIVVGIVGLERIPGAMLPTWQEAPKSSNNTVAMAATANEHKEVLQRADAAETGSAPPPPSRPLPSQPKQNPFDQGNPFNNAAY